MNKYGKIYLIPTPLNDKGLEDTLLNEDLLTISKLKYYIVETPKVARTHLKNIEMENKIQDIDMRVFDEHSKYEDIQFCIEPLLEGYDMGLMSDAGVPCVADPGNKIVRVCQKLGIKVIPLVGASSIILSLMASGLNGQSFTFLGYLGKGKDERRKDILKIERDSRNNNQTYIFIETPYRNQSMFSDILDICKDDTNLCIASDLTGNTETILTKTIREWKEERYNISDKPTIFLIH